MVKLLFILFKNNSLSDKEKILQKFINASGIIDSKQIKAAREINNYL